MQQPGDGLADWLADDLGGHVVVRGRFRVDDDQAGTGPSVSSRPSQREARRVVMA
jgi:hypothetical protein